MTSHGSCLLSSLKNKLEKKPKLKRATSATSSAMASSAVTSIDSLPDEIVLKIVKMCAFIEEGWALDLDFLVDVISKVSVRFRRLATDNSLWKGYVVINADKNPRKAEFVVQECLHSGTRDFLIVGDLADFYEVLTSPRYARFINPTARLPNWKLLDMDDSHISWYNDQAIESSDNESSSGDEKEA